MGMTSCQEVRGEAAVDVAELAHVGVRSSSETAPSAVLLCLDSRPFLTSPITKGNRC